MKNRIKTFDEFINENYNKINESYSLNESLDVDPDRQEELLQKYGITNYLVRKDGFIRIREAIFVNTPEIEEDFLKNTICVKNVTIRGITHVSDDFLRHTELQGRLSLEGVKSVGKDFLRHTKLKVQPHTPAGVIWLDGVERVHKEFLSGKTINSLAISGLKTVHKDFLNTTTIVQNLQLEDLETVDKDFLQNNKVYTLSLNNIKSVHKDFLQNTDFISLHMESLEHADKDFLRNKHIKSSVKLGVKTVDKDFLSTSEIEESLRLPRLEEVPAGFLENTRIGYYVEIPLNRDEEKRLNAMLKQNK